MSPWQSNCYVIAPEGPTDSVRPAIIIDAGPGSFAAVDQVVQEQNLHIVAGLLTHGHFDHVWDAGHFHREWNVPFYLDPADKQMIDDPEQFYGALWAQPKHALAQYGDLASAPTSPLPDEAEFAGIMVRTLSAPGHSGGSRLIMMQTEDGKDICFSGDVLFKGAIGRTDLPGSDPHAMIDTLTRVVKTLPLHTTVFPGHGPATSIVAELATNPFLS